MKPFLFIMLAAFAVTGFSSCGNHNTDEMPPNDTTMTTLPAETAPPVGPVDTSATPVNPRLDSAAREGTMPPR